MAQDQKIILIVDDDPTIVKLLESVLANLGYKTVVARDGLDVMIQVKNVKPHLILLDVMMPEINGYDVCRNLKFDDQYKNIPIILLTSREQEIDPRVGQLMKIDYLQKPIERELLISTIEKNLITV